MGARGAIGSNLQFLVGDLARHQLRRRPRECRRARQSDVRRVDAERIHQVQQLDLLFDRRLADRRRLQAVAQRLVVKANVTIGLLQLRLDRVPVVN